MRHTEETKKKLSEMRKGEKNPFFGKKHTQESLEKMSNWTRERNAKRQYTLSPCTLKNFNNEIAAYLAGIIDGEGTVGERRGTKFVCVYNTSIELMNWLTDFVGGSYRLQHNAGRSPCHCWTVVSVRNVYELLRKVSPFMVIKKEKAKRYIEELHSKYAGRI